VEIPVDVDPAGEVRARLAGYVDAEDPAASPIACRLLVPVGEIGDWEIS